MILVLACVTGCATLPDAHTGTSAAALQAATQALDTGDIEQAVALLTPLALQKGRARLEAMHMLTRIYAITGDRQKQRDIAQAILTLDSADSIALEVLGLLLLGEGYSAAAGEYLERAVQVDPGRWSAWNGLGVIADEETRYADAEAHYLRGLELVPGHPKLLANLGWSRVLAGEARDGEVLLRQSLETAPDSLVTRSNLAFCVALQGRYEEARELYTRLYDASIAANNVGYAALVRRDKELARRYLREAITLKPSFYNKASHNLELAGAP